MRFTNISNDLGRLCMLTSFRLCVFYRSYMLELSSQRMIEVRLKLDAEYQL